MKQQLVKEKGSQKSEEANEEGGQQEREKVVDDVTDWVEVKRRNRRKTAQGKHEEEGRKNPRAVQIFVKVEGSKPYLLDVSLSEKIGDILKRIPNSAVCSRRDVHVTCEGRVLR